MKKLYSFILVLLLAFSLTSPSYAASNLPIPVEGAKTTINLVKSEASSKEISDISFEQGTYTIFAGKFLSLGNIRVIISYKDGSRSYVPLTNGNFNIKSSNENIFTVGQYELRGNSVGSATLITVYEGHTISTNIQVVESSDELVVKLPTLPDNVQQDYINFYEMNYKSEHGYYQYMSINSMYNSNSNELTISGIDWSAKGPYLGYIQHGNRVYKLEVNQEDKGKTIQLNFDPSKYSQVTFEIPDIINSEYIQEISFNAYLDDYQTISAGNFYSLNKQNFPLYIPKGTYNISISNVSNKVAYILANNKISISNSNENIKFNKTDLSKLTFNTDLGNRARLNNAYFCSYDNAGSCLSTYSHEGIDEVNISKKNYDDVGYTLFIDNSWNYSFTKAINLTSNQNIQIGNKLYAKLEFNKSTYNGGSRVYLYEGHADGILSITDKYGNQLSRISDTKGQNVFGKLTFKKGSEIYEVNVTNSLDYASVVLPNAEGTFEVTFTLGDNSSIPDNRTKPDVTGSWKEITNSKGIVNSQYQWTVRFSDDVDASTINNSSIFVVDKDGYLVEGVTATISPSNSKEILISAPSAGYKSGENYTLYIRDSIKSLADKKLSSKVKTTFTIN